MWGLTAIVHYQAFYFLVSDNAAIVEGFWSVCKCERLTKSFQLLNIRGIFIRKNIHSSGLYCRIFVGFLQKATN